MSQPLGCDDCCCCFLLLPSFVVDGRHRHPRRPNCRLRLCRRPGRRSFYSCSLGSCSLCCFVRLSDEVGERRRNGVVCEGRKCANRWEGYVCAVFFGDRGVSEGDLAK